MTWRGARVILTDIMLVAERKPDPRAEAALRARNARLIAEMDLADRARLEARRNTRAQGAPVGVRADKLAPELAPNVVG